MSLTPAYEPASTPVDPPALFGPGTLRSLGRDSLYLLLGLPITIASFSVLVTGLSLAGGLLVTVIGIPVATATLAAAVGFGRLERARLAGAVPSSPPCSTRRCTARDSAG